MGALFAFGLLLYYLLALRGRGRELSKLLWLLYFALGISAMVIAAAGVLTPVFAPNYPATLFLLSCVLISICGFQRFDARHVAHAIASIRNQNLIEATLIVSQLYALIFFMPFAISSLVGDANENRLNLASKIEELGSYGLFNTVAGAASQLFGISLVMACIRLAQPSGRGRNVGKAALLLVASLSYVIYILAYVGRDGMVYWAMTALTVFVVFRTQLPSHLRSQFVTVAVALASLMLVPFVAITVARFVDSDHGSAWSVLDYFGSQINNFSDYSSLDRPMTFGIMNFPMLVKPLCSVAGLNCESWEDIKEVIFAQYLDQDKAPWLFGTFVSDFVGDFGFAGTLAIVTVLAGLSYRVSRHSSRSPLTLARLLLLLFLFLVPYWGVFYFRFSIINGFIVVNLGFIYFVSVLQRRPVRKRRRLRRRTNGPPPQALPAPES